MPSSAMSPTRIITVLSLVALSTLSFTLVFRTDTLSQHTLTNDFPFAFSKGNNVLHHGRALHHARASISPTAPEPNSAQSSLPPPSPTADSPASSSPPLFSPSPSSQSPPPPQSSSSSPAPSPATSSSPGVTSASSSSPPPPPTSSSPSPTPSSSSSLNAAATSSHAVTSSSAGVVSNVANSPTTTFVYNPNSYKSGAGSLPSSTGSTLTIAADPTAGAVSSGGFFKNKAAVGVTFSIIGIVGGLGAIMAVLAVMKRHRRARAVIEDEEFFEKYPSGDFGSEPHSPPGFGTGSIPDITTTAATPDAYPDREIHYGQSNSNAVFNPVNYGIAYPPGEADDNSTPASGSGNAYENAAPSHSHPFADPANASYTTAAPPVTFPRPTFGRAQEMVTTDSYYGPNSAGVGAVGVGYAQ